MKVIAKVLGNTGNMESVDLTIEEVASQQTRFTFKTPQPDANYHFLGMRIKSGTDIDTNFHVGIGMNVMYKTNTYFQIFDGGKYDSYARVEFLVFRIDEGEDNLLPTGSLMFNNNEIIHHSDYFTGNYTFENNDYNLVLETTKDLRNRIVLVQTISDTFKELSIRKVDFNEKNITLQIANDRKQKWSNFGAPLAGIQVLVYDTSKYFDLPIKEIKSIYDYKIDVSIADTVVTSVDNYATGKYKVTLNKNITDDMIIFCDLDSDPTYTERSSTIDFSRTGVSIGSNEFDVFVYTSRGIYAYQNSFFSLKFIETKEVL